jgi:Ger(x)C family germination protein
MESKKAGTRMRKSPVSRLFALLMLPVLLTGCWDRVEIQDRLFVLAAGIDKNVQKEQKRSYYEFTAQLVEPRALSGKVSLPNVSPVWNPTSSGPSIFECIRLMATRVARQPYYEHLQAIIIGEELAKEGIDRSLDLFYRDHESRRKIKLIIAKGKAKEALYVKPRLMPLPGRYISKLTEEGESKTARLPATTSIGEFSRNFHNGENSILPAIRVEQNEVKMAGGAIMKGDRLIGWLSDHEIKTLRWINGTFSKGDEVIVKLTDADERPSFITMEVKGARSTVKTSVENGKPVITLLIRGEGNIAEDGFGNKPTVEKIKKKEEQINHALKQRVEKLIAMMQQKHGIDIFGFGEEFRRFQYAYWKAHKHEWDALFKEAEIRIDVQTFIRRYGQFK